MDCEEIDKGIPCKYEAAFSIEYRENGKNIIKNLFGMHAIRTQINCS